MKIKIIFFIAVSIFISNSAFALTENTATENTAHRRLASMVPVYEGAARGPWIVISTNQPLKKGSQGNMVALLHEHLCKTQDLICKDSKRSSVFNEEIEQGVRSFQERHNLKPDGIVGSGTLAALNVSPKIRLQQIQVNLTRLDRLSKNAEARYIWINVPDCRLRLVENHHAVVTFPVIAGKVSRKTPEINSKVTRVILNPCWHVPPTILKNDVIPKAASDPGYLARSHIRVFAASAPQKELSVKQLNWQKIKQSPGAYIFRQDPGVENSLGQIKFDFSNPHSVYLHDTPKKELFDAEKRLFSSGCIRLKDPILFLEHLIERDPGLTKQKTFIEKAIELGNTTTVQFAKPIPIHITYITAWVDSAGKLHFWEDVYKHDEQLVIQKNNEEKDLPQPV